MSREYKGYTVPALTDPADIEAAFDDFTDDLDTKTTAIEAAIADVEANAGNLKYLVTNAQGSGYTLVLADAGKLIEMSGGGTLTIPTNASVPFPVGTQITVLQTGASQVTIAPAGTVTANSSGGYLKVAAQWSAVTLVKRATNSWVALGALVA